MNDLAIGFCVYNPNDIFYKRLEILNVPGRFIYLYDNSQETSLTIDGAVKVNKYFHDSLNSGLGNGLNWILHQAFIDEHKYLVYFDQDTIFTEETIKFIESFISSNRFPDNFSSIQIAAKSSVDVVNSFDSFKDFDSLNKTLLQINSGTIFNLPIMNLIGFHDKTFFIDGIDYCHCLNSAINGYTLGFLSGAPDFDHDAGQGYAYYSFFGKFKGVRKYNLSRMTDYTISSIRLFLKALYSCQFYYSFLFTKLFFLYILDQMLVRIFAVSQTNE